jgi:photosystem II stability/assembly factor-like uncharacterized protein
MKLRLAAALVLALGLAAAAPAPGLAQRIPPPELTVTPQTIEFPSSLWGVSFADANHGLAVGSYHSMFRTTDGGATWKRQGNPLPTRPPLRYDRSDAETPSQGSFTAVVWVDPDYGVAVSNLGAVVVTSDGGATWDIRPTPAPDSVPGNWPGNIRPSSWSFTGASFIDRDHGYVVGADGVILATTDGGRTWAYQGRPEYGILEDVQLADQEHAQIVGLGSGRADGVRYTTLGTNDGATWQVNLADEEKDDVVGTSLKGVAVTVPMHAIAVGEAGRILVTFDEGKTWRVRRNGTNETLYDVAFADRRRGIAVGGVNFQGDSRAIVLATNDAGEHWTAFPEPNIGYLSSVTFASPTVAYAVGCTDVKITGEVFEGEVIPPFDSCNAAIARIDFPELDASIEEPVSSGGSALPFLLLGAAVVIAGGGLLLARRR